MELESLRSALAPFYPQIKFIHLLFVMMWSFSTAVAYSWYVKSTFQRWQRNPNDAAAKQQRDWAMEQFDKGAIMEHIAFPIILITGPMLYFIAGWPADSGWLFWKLLILALIFVPMEIVDYYLAHFGGNKARIRSQGDQEKYEAYMLYHWKFLKLSTPFVALFIPTMVYLAVVKPI